MRVVLLSFSSAHQAMYASGSLLISTVVVSGSWGDLRVVRTETSFQDATMPSRLQHTLGIQPLESDPHYDALAPSR